MVVASSSVFVSAGISRAPGAADWSADGTIAFGAGPSVALMSNPAKGIDSMLQGHKSRVNVVRCFQHAGVGGDALVSCSTDKTARVWTKTGPPGRGGGAGEGEGEGEGAASWVCSATFKGHTGSVNCADVLVVADRAWIVTASTDGTARIYTHVADSSDEAVVANGGWSCLDTVMFGSGIRPGQLPISVSLALMPGTLTPVLAVGGDDAKIRIFCYTSTAVAADGEGKGGGQGGAATFQLMTTLTGHEDWVRSLTFATGDTGMDLLLASASQDSYVRVWRISPSTDGALKPGRTLSFTERALRQSRFLFSLPAPAAAAAAVDAAGPASYWEAKLDALLTGHDGWVYSVRWQPCKAGEPQPLALLSASMDRTMIVWSPDPAGTGVWIDSARVGEVGGTYIQGFFGGLWAPHGKRIMAHGFHGAFYCWDAVEDESSSSDAGGGAAAATESTAPAAPAAPTAAVPTRWVATPGPTGHFSEARDLAWDPTGTYFVTVSDDQTARLFMPCKAAGEQPASWHEVARPQVHGYDMRCAVFTAPHVLVTGSDEKVIRVFEAPGNFFEAAAALCNVADSTVAKIATAGASMPMGASIPALGLSNKAIFKENGAKGTAAAADGAAGATDGESDSFATPAGGGGGVGGGDGHLGGVDGTTRTAQATNGVVLPYAGRREVKAAPDEAHLVQNTLWPETQKLFGHGFELITLAANHAGTLVVSACKATSSEHAVLRVWSTASWQEVYTLEGHKLTVTRAAFSPSDEWLVSGSRDRQICIYRRENAGDDEQAGGDGGNAAAAAAAVPQYTLVQTISKAHDRIIWDVCWTPDSAFFATGSRDKTVTFWAPNPETKAWVPAHKTEKLGDSVTALDFAPTLALDGSYVLAVGFDQGSVVVYNAAATAAVDGTGMTTVVATASHAVDPSLCPPVTIKRLKWRVGESSTAAADAAGAACSSNSWSKELAFCAVDSSVRIISVVVD